MDPSVKKCKKNEISLSLYFDQDFIDDSRGKGCFVYVLPCVGKLEEYTWTKNLALGSLLGFRKFGRA